MWSDADDSVANDFRTENPPSVIATLGGEDYIWTHLFQRSLTVDGGAGFDIFKIPDGWWGNFEVVQNGNDFTITHLPEGSYEVIHVTNVELVIIDTYEGSTHEWFLDPYFTDKGDSVDWNHLTDVQTGLFNAIKYLGGGYYASSYLPDLYNSGAGDDVVHLPNAANYVIHDDGYDGADLIYDYAREFNAGEGDDTVYGGDYNDIINGGDGDDDLRGGAGNDTIRDHPFSKDSEAVGGSIDGGAGNDRAELTYRPTRIVTTTGTVVWKEGDSTTITSDGQKLLAEYTDAAGTVIGTIAIVNVETIWISSLLSPSRLLFSDFANVVNFATLTDSEKAAISQAIASGQTSSLYTALNGDDVVYLPANGAALGTGVTWNSATTFNAGGGDDHIVGSSGSDRIDGSIGQDWIEGGAGADLLLGGYDDDRLDGGAGADDLQGGAGDDVYVIDNANDAVTELSGAGEDQVLSTVTYVLGPYVERLTLIGSAIQGTGNGIANVITGNDADNRLLGMGGNDVLDGMAGADRLTGGTGDDLYIVDATGDVVVEAAGEGTDQVKSSISLKLSANVENLLLTGASSIDGTGNDLANVLTGNDARNVLNGGLGDDRMVGHGGNDSYHVNSSGDVVVEADNQGLDTILADIDLTLAANVENLTLKGTADLQGTGNTLANILVGTSGNNILSGAAGNDRLRGMAGNDTLKGDEGADQMEGGAGDDVYYVDQLGDRAIEAIGAGNDVVLVSDSFTLTAGTAVEELRFLDPASSIAAKLVGNKFDQRIVGNAGDNILNGVAGNDALEGSAGNDVLDGGIGSDVLDGGTGDDLLIVDNATDVVIEALGQGSDTLVTTVDYVLAADAEVETLRARDAAATSAIDITGNSFAQTIKGNAGANNLSGDGGDDTLTGLEGNDSLDGGFGSDSLYGGQGNDTYLVDTVLDGVFEKAGEGSDTVYCSASFALRGDAEVEFLFAVDPTATTTIDLTGNAYAQTIQGNAGSNRLNGFAGDDILIGGKGNDTLIGGDGNDKFVFAETGGTDRITDFVRGEDKIDLSLIDANAGVAGNQSFAFIGAAAFSHVAGQLRTYVTGTTNFAAGDVNGDGIADFVINLGSVVAQSGDFTL